MNARIRAACATALAVAACAAAPAGALEVEGAPLLHPREAFTFAAELKDGAAQIQFAIRPGYYLYRDRFAFAAPEGVRLGSAELPPGLEKHDEFFGDVQIYRDAVAFSIPVSGSGEEIRMNMVSQGCADIGVCYPPEQVTLAFASTGGPGRIVGDYSVPDYAGSDTSSASISAGEGAALDESAEAFAVLAERNLLGIVAAFFVFGVLLSFTPCVLPMVPIVLAAVTGGKSAPGTGRALVLCGAFVSAMAAVYAALGLATAQSGILLSYYLQHPLALVLFAFIFVALGASMLGAFELRLMPVRATGWIAGLRATQGTLRGALLFGATSALIVSPCVAAPLVGALLFIAQRNDPLLGGTALAAMGLGMGVLPLAAAAGAGSLLPRAGPFAAVMRKLFGLLMLGLAIWIASALLPPVVRMAGYGTLGLIASLLVARSAWSMQSRWGSRAAGVCAALLVLGSSAMFAGAASGATSELRPLARMFGGAAAAPEFAVVSSPAALKQALAAGTGRTTLIEFSADWCVSCRELEEFTFTDPRVAEQLSALNLLRADVTEPSAASRELLASYGLLGPPAMIFIGEAGTELGRVVGYQPPGRFLESLAAVGS